MHVSLPLCIGSKNQMGLVLRPCVSNLIFVSEEQPKGRMGNGLPRFHFSVFREESCVLPTFRYGAGDIRYTCIWHSSGSGVENKVSSLQGTPSGSVLNTPPLHFPHGFLHCLFLSFFVSYWTIATISSLQNRKQNPEKENDFFKINEYKAKPFLPILEYNLTFGQDITFPKHFLMESAVLSCVFE